MKTILKLGLLLIFAPVVSFSQTVTNGLIGHWSFDNDLTTDQSQSTNAHNGIKVGTPTSVDGRFKESYDFNGGDAIEIADHSDLSFTNGTSDQPFSISFWMNPKVQSQYSAGLVTKWGGLGKREYITYFIGGDTENSGKLRFFILNDPNGDNTNLTGLLTETVRTFPIDQWYHIVCTYNPVAGNSTDMKIFVNGEEVSFILPNTTFTGTNYQRMQNTGAKLRVGRHIANDNTFRDFNGKIDEVRLYDRSLSANEAGALYANTTVGNYVSSDKLVGYWPLNENLLDESIYTQHGFQGAGTSYVERITGNSAMRFDGTGYATFPGAGHLSFSDGVNDKPATISFWIKPEFDDRVAGGVISKWNGTTGREYIIYFHENFLGGKGLIWQVYDESTLQGRRVRINTPLQDGVWQHVVCEYDGLSVNGLKVYLDGQEAGITTLANDPNYSISRPNNLTSLSFGTFFNHAGTPYSFKGSLDEVKIFKKLLTPTEIADLMNETTNTGQGGFNNIYEDGANIGIGTPVTNGYKLAVAGDIVAEKVKVVAQVWPDYVFDENYDLQDLDSLKEYINQNKHLPGIKEAEVIEKEGVELSEMTPALLEKIEELTLYAIAQKEQTELLKQQIELLKKQIRALEEAK